MKTDSFLRRELIRVIEKHWDNEGITDYAICFNYGNSDHTTSFYSSDPNMELQNGVVYLLNDIINDRLTELDNKYEDQN